MPLDLLLQETKGLSDEALMEVVRFIRFMKLETMNQSRRIEVPGEDRKVRHAGKYQGLIKIADDFDAPMDDFREYM